MTIEGDDRTIEKTLNHHDSHDVRRNIPDIEFFGDPDQFSLLCKASSVSEGWMKSAKAMEIPGVGCVVQVTTQQKNPDSSYAVAEAITFVPGVKIKVTHVRNAKVDGRKLVVSAQEKAKEREPSLPPPKPAYKARWRHKGTGSIIYLREGVDPGDQWFEASGGRSSNYER